MLPELTSLLFDRCPAIFGGARNPSAIDYLGLPGAVEGGTTTFIGFCPEQRRPLFAVKVHRDADAGQRAMNEEKVLNHLNTHAADLARSVPQVVLCDRVSGCWVVVMTILDGRPMGITLDAAGLPVLREAEENLQNVSAWLARLHRVQIPGFAPNHGTAVAFAARKTEEFAAVFNLGIEELAFLEEINAIPHETVRTSITHGDFCRHNILVSDVTPELGVVDWTDSEAVGVPLHDLLFFVSTYFMQVRRKIGLDGIKDAFFQTFFGSTEYAALVQDSINAHRDCLADRRPLRLQLGLFLVFQAMREAEKLERLTRTSGVPRITLWLAGEVDSEYEEARRASFWRYLFRDLSQRVA